MTSHGGKREGSGQPPKFPNRPNTKRKRVPRDIPNHLIDLWINKLITLKDAGFPVESMSEAEIIDAYRSLGN